MNPGRVAQRHLFAVLAIGLAACGSGASGSLSSAPAADVKAETTREPAPSLPDTTPSMAAETPATQPPITATVTSPPPDGADATDPADIYLPGTTEVYRRTLADGQDFVVRLSTGSYASVFGLTWTAPTGSADTCLGDHAALFGVPGDIGDWGSAWVASPWQNDPGPTTPPIVQASMRAAADPPSIMQFLVIRTDASAADVVLTTTGGTELDRGPVSNGIAMVVDSRGTSITEPRSLSVAIVASNGERSVATPLGWPTPVIRSECGPGEAPRRPLPPAGDQPADPAAAEAQIRARHAVLVDQSIDAADKPDDLLDDNTGVDVAAAGVKVGPYGDVAATAKYSIDEVVFTRPDEAWFRYTITTSSSAFTDRFGRADFNGAVWQITRATICQDLALAASRCQPEAPVVEPPASPAWEAASQEWVRRAMLYAGNDGCPPLSQC